ncbi:hypothetical protein GPL19_10265 [Enterocloster bolteae]|nr:hypothetical protein [Enterocloster bolteae]
MQEKMEDLDREHLYLINLTTKCRPINANLISVGSLGSITALGIREFLSRITRRMRLITGRSIKNA